MTDLFPSSYLCFTHKDLIDILDTVNPGSGDFKRKYQEAFLEILTTLYRLIRSYPRSGLSLSEFNDVNPNVDPANAETPKNLEIIPALRMGDRDVFHRQLARLITESTNAINRYDDKGGYQLLEIPSSIDDLKVIRDERDSRGSVTVLLPVVYYTVEGTSKKIYRFGQLVEWFDQATASGRFLKKEAYAELPVDRKAGLIPILEEEVTLHPRGVIMYFQQFNGALSVINSTRIPVFQPTFNSVEQMTFIEYAQYTLNGVAKEVINALLEAGVNPPQIGMRERHQEGESRASILLSTESEPTQQVELAFRPDMKDFTQRVIASLVSSPSSLKIVPRETRKRTVVVTTLSAPLPPLPDLPLLQQSIASLDALPPLPDPFGIT